VKAPELIIVSTLTTLTGHHTFEHDICAAEIQGCKCLLSSVSEQAH